MRLVVLIALVLPHYVASVDPQLDPNLHLTTSYNALGFIAAGTQGRSTNRNDASEVFKVEANPQIRYGEDAASGLFPFMVSLQVLWSNGVRYHICGGTLYAPNKVLTAAHCLPYWGLYDHYVALGVHDISVGGEQVIGVYNVSIHPEFSSVTQDYPNDVAVLTLDKDAIMTANVQTADLATRQDGLFKTMSECHVMGWGATENKKSSDILRWVTTLSLSNNDCRKFLRVFQYLGLQQHHLCAWNWPHIPCQGDSGGPLVCDDVIAGVSSWGVSGCTGCFPSVFSRVSYHNNWIMLQ